MTYVPACGMSWENNVRGASQEKEECGTAPGFIQRALEGFTLTSVFVSLSAATFLTAE